MESLVSQYEYLPFSEIRRAYKMSRAAEAAVESMQVTRYVVIYRYTRLR